MLRKPRPKKRGSKLRMMLLKRNKKLIAFVKSMLIKKGLGYNLRRQRSKNVRNFRDKEHVRKNKRKKMKKERSEKKKTKKSSFN